MENNNFDDRRYEFSVPQDPYAGTRHELFYDGIKLGSALLFYRIMCVVIVYICYFSVYIYYTGAFDPDYGKVIDYLRDNHYSTVTSTAFIMSLNIAVTLSSLIITFAFIKVIKLRLDGYFAPSREGIKQGLIWAPACFVANMVISLIINIFTTYLGDQGISIPDADFSIKSPSTAAVLMQLAYVILVGPIIEETIYRGFILGALSRYGSGTAILVSSLAFGLMHGNISQAASAFATGALYAAIAIRCGSVFPTIVIHMVNNIIASYSDISDALNIPSYDAVFSVAVIAVALAGFYVIFTRHSFISVKTPDAIPNNGVIKSLVRNPAMLVYFGVLIVELVGAIIEANK
ncbi:MAG: CPBP family intramembrane metalloprotease [Ruminococcus sp.]|nr:CPBP family intramembrane metalloprotease [Ruminococcus sp.]